MSMKSASDPRRLYTRGNQVLVTYAGLYFAGRGTKVDPKQTVVIEPAKRDHGKARIKVTQGDLVETWTEQHLTFKSR
jgi:hypothetical protein